MIEINNGAFNVVAAKRASIETRYSIELNGLEEVFRIVLPLKDARESGFVDFVETLKGQNDICIKVKDDITKSIKNPYLDQAKIHRIDIDLLNDNYRIEFLGTITSS